MTEPTVPSAPRVLTFQLSFGADRADLDELTELVKAALEDVTPKRVTMLDAYYLVNGQRTTKAMLAEQAKEPASRVNSRPDAREDVNGSTPVGRAQQGAPAKPDFDPDMTEEDLAARAARAKK